MSQFARLASVGAVVRAVRLAIRPGGPSIGERAGAVPRMIRATASGQYTGTTVGRLLLMGAAAGYLITPVDLIPELVIPVLGLADDALVLSWLATRLVEETESFLEWERAGMPGAAPGASAGGPDAWAPPPGTGGSAGPRAPGGAASHQTVPGDVVS